MSTLMAKLKKSANRAICRRRICQLHPTPVNGKPARYDDSVVIVGASEMYEARCREHHQVPRG
jgi:thymidine kinase